MKTSSSIASSNFDELQLSVSLPCTVILIDGIGTLDFFLRCFGPLNDEDATK